MTIGAPTPPDRGLGGTPAIDRSVPGEWLPGDDAAVNELLVVFRDSVRAELDRMRELLALSQFEEYANAAHRMRGAALQMGARALAEFVGLLFIAARAQDGTACANGMPMLETHVRLMAAEVPEVPGTDDGTGR